MHNLTKAERKKIIEKELKEFYQNEQFEKHSAWDNGYQMRKYFDKTVFLSSFTFLSSQNSVSYGYSLSINIIEDIILEIEHPSFDFTRYKTKELVLPTLNMSYFENDKYILYTSDNCTEDECILLSENIINHYYNIVLPLISYCTYLPNILTEMDKLDSEGKDWNEVLAGMGDRLFRGLIIAHLCNDPNYEKKEAFCDYKFNNVALLKDWLPYYEKLKERLKTVDPIYNL